MNETQLIILNNLIDEIMTSNSNGIKGAKLATELTKMLYTRDLAPFDFGHMAEYVLQYPEKFKLKRIVYTFNKSPKIFYWRDT